VYAVVIRFVRVIRAAICIGLHIRVPDDSILKGYDKSLSVFQTSYSFVDRQHKVMEMWVIIFTRLHVVTYHKTPILTVLPVRVTTILLFEWQWNYFCITCANLRIVCAYRGTGWVFSPPSGITVLYDPSLVRDSKTACEWVGCVCCDQDNAHRQRLLEVLMYIQIQEKAKNISYIRRNMCLSRRIIILQVSYLRIWWVFKKLFILVLLFKISPCERSKNLDASSRYTYTVLNATTHRMEKGALNLSTWCQLELSYITWRNWTWQQTRHNTSISWYPAKRGNGEGYQNRFLTPRHPPLCSNIAM
jgi:hypothetical protein